MSDEVFCKCGEVLGYKNTLSGAPILMLATNYIRHESERGLYRYCKRPQVDARGFVVGKDQAVKGVRVLETTGDLDADFRAATVEHQREGKPVVIPNHTEIIRREDLPASIECRKCEATNILQLPT